MHSQGGMPIPDILHINQPYWYAEGADISPDDFGVLRAKELENKILEVGAGQIAAFIAEPVLASGGVIIPPDGYHKRALEICHKYDVLYISDEVVTGFGRLGSWFASEEIFGITPDIITCAKGLTSGYMPMGATIISDRLMNTLATQCEDSTLFSHGFTYSGHPIACAAALATLDIIERENIVDRVASDVSPYLQSKWMALSDHPIVGHVRGLGMLGSIELVRNKATKERLAPEQSAGGVCRELCIDNGLVMRAVGDSMIISPQLIMNHSEIDTMLEKVIRALDQTAEHYSV